MDQLLIEIHRDTGGTLRRRVRRLPPNARMSGAAAPWIWRRLQATRAALTQ